MGSAVHLQASALSTVRPVEKQTEPERSASWSDPGVTGVMYHVVVLSLPICLISFHLFLLGNSDFQSMTSSQTRPQTSAEGARWCVLEARREGQSLIVFSVGLLTHTTK